MLTKSTKSILRALALILAVLMTASVCLVGCTDKNAQTAADEAKAAADAAKALAQEAKDAATSAVSEKTLNDELAKAVDQAKAQATADIANALADYAKKADLDALSATAINALSAELAKKVNAGDVYTKAEIDSKLAALGGTTATGDASEAIAKALADAKAYTDAAIAKAGTAAATGELSEAAIAEIIKAAFEDYDKVTADLVLASGKIYMDVYKIYALSYTAEDFKTLYAYIDEYIGLALDKDEEFTGAIQQQLKFDLYSAIPTVLSLLRMSSSEKLAKVVAAFDAAASVVSIDEKVLEIAEAILAIGTEKEMTGIPAALVVTGSDYKIADAYPVIRTLDQFNNEKAQLQGKFFDATATYNKGDLIYVTCTDGYSILTVTADDSKGATYTDYTVPATAYVVTVNDYAKYETVLKLVDAFVAKFGYVTGTNVAVDIKGAKADTVETVIVAHFTENAFTVVSGTDSTNVTADFPVFGFDYVAPTANSESGIYTLIKKLTNYIPNDDEDETVSYYNKTVRLGYLNRLMANIGITAELGFYYLDKETDDKFGAYVNDYFKTASKAYDFAAHKLDEAVEAAALALATYTDAYKTYSVDALFGKMTPSDAKEAYEDLVDALDAAIKTYELFNLGANKNIVAEKTVLIQAQAYLKAYDLTAAANEREAKYERLYREAVAEFVNEGLNLYVSNTSVYKRQTQEFKNAAFDIVYDYYLNKVAIVPYSVAGALIKAVKIEGNSDPSFEDQLKKYMTDKYYTPLKADIDEAYAQYSEWLYIQEDTLAIVKAYYEAYMAKDATATDSNVKSYSSGTDVLYYSIGAVLFGTDTDGKINGKDYANVDDIGLFAKIYAALKAEIIEAQKTEPAVGTYKKACDAIKAKAAAAITKVAETYLEVCDAKFKIVDAAKMAVVDEFVASTTELIAKTIGTTVDAKGLQTSIDALKATLEAVKATPADLKVMGLIGSTYGEFAVVTNANLAVYPNRYEAKLVELKASLISMLYQAWFTNEKDVAAENMSACYRGDKVVLYPAIKASTNNIVCLNDLYVLFNTNYKTLSAMEFIIPVTMTNIASLSDLQAAVKAEMWTLVSNTNYLMMSYAQNRADYDQTILDAKKLINAIETINTKDEDLKGFYVAGSKFDNALTVLKNVVANAQYALGSYAVDATTTAGYIAFVSPTDKAALNVAIGFTFDMTAGYKDGKYTAADYYDATLYAKYCIANAEIEMAKLWKSANPLLSEELDPDEAKLAEEKYVDIVDAVLGELGIKDTDPAYKNLIKYLKMTGKV